MSSFLLLNELIEDMRLLNMKDYTCNLNPLRYIFEIKNNLSYHI